MCVFDISIAFYVVFAISRSNLERIGRITKKWQQFFRNLRWRPPPSWILVSLRFWRESRILYQIRHIPVKFGDDWMNNKEMATVFLNSRWRRTPFWIFNNLHFWQFSYIPYRIRHMPTKFGENRSNSNEMATVFRNPRWRRPPSWKLHFRLNRQYEKGIPFFYISNQKSSFHGVTLTFEGSLLSRALNAKKRSTLQIGQVHPKRVENLVFWGLRPP